MQLPNLVLIRNLEELFSEWKVPHCLVPVASVMDKLTQDMFFFVKNINWFLDFSRDLKASSNLLYTTCTVNPSLFYNANCVHESNFSQLCSTCKVLVNLYFCK